MLTFEKVVYICVYKRVRQNCKGDHKQFRRLKLLILNKIMHERENY